MYNTNPHLTDGNSIHCNSLFVLGTGLKITKFSHHRGKKVKHNIATHKKKESGLTVRFLRPTTTTDDFKPRHWRRTREYGEGAIFHISSKFPLKARLGAIFVPRAVQHLPISPILLCVSSDCCELTCTNPSSESRLPTKSFSPFFSCASVLHPEQSAAVRGGILPHARPKDCRLIRRSFDINQLSIEKLYDKLYSATHLCLLDVNGPGVQL